MSDKDSSHKSSSNSMTLEKKLKIPQHIAIIMDGNGRWSKKVGVSKINGYKKGIENAEKIIKAAKNIGVKFLTIYAFSTENWQRSQYEVNGFMQLLHNYLYGEVEHIIQEDVRVIFIGDHSKISLSTRQLMKNIEVQSKNNNFYLIVALSYGGRQQIWQASVQLCKYVIENNIQIENIDKLSIKVLDGFINPYGIPDPDLFIRTGGDCRVSNFLLWQLAYSELYFTSKLWPEFNEEDLNLAVAEYSTRERRYGK